jgi:hypothetical protein
VTDTTEQAGDAGLGDAGQTHDDEIDTEAFDRAPAPEEVDDDAEAAKGGDTDDAGDADPDDDKDGGEDETFEIEGKDGKKFKVPAALKDEFLMRADYTKKTQAVAETAKQLAEKEQALADPRGPASREPQGAARGLRQGPHPGGPSRDGRQGA